MKGLMNVAMAIFLLAIPLSVRAEYLIYLKGGHYIVADDCTFTSRQEIEQEGGGEKELVFVKDCTIGKPEGLIFWSTIDGRFGEIDANNVYAIYGSKGLRGIKPPRTTMPLEDYLITNRDESFVNAKIYEEKDTTVLGFKRDDFAKIDRRGLMEIAPEGEAKTRSGEGLCPGETSEFSITETELVGSNLVGVVTNLSKAPWKPLVEVEVREKGKLKGKFRVTDPSTESNVLDPDNSVPFDEAVPARFLKYVERVKEPEAGVRLCFRKVKTGARQPVAAQPPAAQLPK